MYRIIGGDGREYGPVTGDTIRQWVVQNRANSKTLIRPEDSPDWRPLGEVPEFAGSFGAAPPQPPPYTAPGAAPTPASTVSQPRSDFREDLPALTANLTHRDYRLDLGACIGDAFNLLGRKFWLVVGGTAIVMVCSIALSLIPILGPLSSLFLTEVFNGGLYFYFMKLVRDEPASIGDAFSGFSRSFGQLVLLTLVRIILILICALPVVLPIIGMALWKWNPVVMIPIVCVCFVPLIYLAVSWMFSSMLVIDRGYEFWDAMELSRKVVGKHWFLVFILSVVAGIIGAVGLIVLFVGMLVTMPVAIAAMVYAYETMFPRVGPNESPTTPAAPTTPTAPATPAVPVAPEEPGSVAEPNPSGEPGTPASPTEPGDPSNPSGPTTPLP